MKQVRYTQGRMAERSKAPDSRNSPWRLLVHECVRGFESHSCQFLRSKRQHFNRSSIESHSRQILRSKSQHFGPRSISESQIKSKTKQISHYKKVLSKTGWSKCDILKAGWPSGLRRQTQEILLGDFWYTNVCVGSNPTPVNFLRSKRQHFNRSSIESHSRQILRSKSQHFGPRSISESQIKSKTKQISHYNKVLSKTGWSKCDILKAGWPSGLRRQTQEILLGDFWYTNVCVGSNPSPVKFSVQKGNILVQAVSIPTSVKFCVQKSKILVEAVFVRVKSRARRSRFHITTRCYRRQDEASAIYSRQDGRAI